MRDACVCAMEVSADPLAAISHNVAQCLHSVAARVCEFSWLLLVWVRLCVCYYSSVPMLGRAGRVVATPATSNDALCVSHGARGWP